MVKLPGRKLYLDSNTLIYAIEGLAPNLQAQLLLPIDAGKFSAVTSEIALVETVIGPRRRRDHLLERDFRAFLTPRPNFFIEPVNLAVLEKVIDLRAQFGMKIPDAIHIATGILASCDLFVSADKAWGRTGIEVVDPAEIA